MDPFSFPNGCVEFFFLSAILFELPPLPLKLLSARHICRRPPLSLTRLPFLVNASYAFVLGFCLPPWGNMLALALPTMCLVLGDSWCRSYLGYLLQSSGAAKIEVPFFL